MRCSSSPTRRYAPTGPSGPWSGGRWRRSTAVGTAPSTTRSTTVGSTSKRCASAWPRCLCPEPPTGGWCSRSMFFPPSWSPHDPSGAAPQPTGPHAPAPPSASRRSPRSDTAPRSPGPGLKAAGRVKVTKADRGRSATVAGGQRAAGGSPGACRWPLRTRRTRRTSRRRAGRDRGRSRLIRVRHPRVLTTAPPGISCTQCVTPTVHP